MNRFDILVIGGGINGVGIARDAAGRGLSVCLCERGDLGGATSSASSKLIHGGLRYLEYGEFGLVRESLRERRILLDSAPHLVRPMDFVLPLSGDSRPAWMIRLGLFLYDRLAGGGLGESQRVVLSKDNLGAALRPVFGTGFLYRDCWGDDARLVIATARDAADRGAVIRPRTVVTAAVRAGDRWEITVEDGMAGTTEKIAAPVVVNAAGPWAERVARDVLRLEVPGRLRLVAGSHLIVPRLYQGDHAFLFQNDDGRVVFLLPFERHYSLIGTTEDPVEDPDAPTTTDKTFTAYLCRAVSRYLAKPVAPAMVIRSFTGVRPLYDDGSADDSAVSREYRLIKDAPDQGPVTLSVFGGKLTTYRRLAERAVDMLVGAFPAAGPSWTGGAQLPGGDIDVGDVDTFINEAATVYPWLPREILQAMVQRHGSLITEVLATATCLDDLGRAFGGDLFERELVWFREREWAVTGEDVLWRRSKAWLHLSPAERDAVAAWMAARRGALPSAVLSGDNEFEADLGALT